MINESFPAIEFHDFYIHCQPDVLSKSALLSTVYMYVQDSTVHSLSGIREPYRSDNVVNEETFVSVLRDPRPFESQPPVTGLRGSPELAFRQWRYS